MTTLRFHYREYKHGETISDLQKFELAGIALVSIPDVTGIRCGCKIEHICTQTHIHTYTHTRMTHDTETQQTDTTDTCKTQAGFLRYIPPVVISI